jgi:putative hydrolase of the HAD superfamily
VSAIRAVLLDAVGTLLRLREPVGESYARAARACGVVLPAWRIDEAFRRILAAAPPMVFPGEPPARVRELERGWWKARVRETFKATDQTARFARFDDCADALFAYYATAAAWQPAPGAAAALAALRSAGLRLAVASNFDHRLAGILEALDLLSFFERVWGPAEAGAQKPEPAFFTGLVARLGLPASAVVHVGDDPEQDVAAARRAGLRAIALEPPATLADLPARIRALEDERPGALQEE